MKYGSWITFPHEHLSDEYEVDFIETNRRYLITMAKSEKSHPVLTYFKIDAERFSRKLDLDP